MRSLAASTAYFQGDPIGRDIYLRPPKGLAGVVEGALLKAERSIYGFTDAARKWWTRVGTGTIH